jgi:hypothetical protein
MAPREQLRNQAETTRRGGGLRRLPDLLTRLLDPASRRRGLAEARVLTDWPSIVGAGLAARCQPVKLTGGGHGHGGVLHVHVAGTAALELQHSEPQLIERINSYFGHPAVARLRLIQAPVRRVAPRPAAVVAPLGADERAQIDLIVQPIEDDGLRTALAGLGATLKSRSGRYLR